MGQGREKSGRGRCSRRESDGDNPERRTPEQRHQPKLEYSKAISSEKGGIERGLVSPSVSRLYFKASRCS